MQRRSPFRLRHVAAAVALVAALAPTAPQAGALGERYPGRPIEFLVPWGTGGGADVMARTLSPLAQPVLGVPLPVSNVPGNSGNTGLARLLGAPADGYTVAVYTAAMLAAVSTETAASTLDDFAWVARTQVEDAFLFVAADSPFATIHVLLEHARTHPRKLLVAGSGFGTVDYISVRYLATRGYRMTFAPYAMPEERYAAAVKGHAQVLYEQAGDVKSLLETKQLKPILIFAGKRHPAFPDVPASRELGLEIELPQFRAVVAKAGTPPERLRVLAEAFRQAIATPEWRKFAEEHYMRPDSFLGPEAFGPWVRQQAKLLTTYVKELGARGE